MDYRSIFVDCKRKKEEQRDMEAQMGMKNSKDFGNQESKFEID